MDIYLILLCIVFCIACPCCVLFSRYIFKNLRSRFPVAVNCWFCNTDTKVPYDRKNSFVCPECKQYNGFNEDGDYNCDLPAQYCESLNSPVSRQWPNQNDKLRSTHQQATDASINAGLSLGNGLCQTCNLYQAMKVKALGDFIPSHPDKYDEEVELYEQRLERLYGGLCRVCTQTLKCTLGEQDSWLKPKLLHWRLKQSILMKKLLIPSGNNRTVIKQQMSLLLRLLCAASLLAFAIVLTAKTFFESSSFNESGNSTVPVTTLYMEYTDTVMKLGDTYLCGHEAGVFVAQLTSLLAAVALTGQHMIRIYDAFSCFLLVFLIILSSFEISLPLVLVPYQPYMKITTTVLTFGAVCISFGSLLSDSNNTKRSSPYSTPGRDKKNKLDLSQRSDLSCDSACSTPRGRPFSPQVSTVAPSCASSIPLSSGHPVMSAQPQPSPFPQAAPVVVSAGYSSSQSSQSNGFKLRPSALQRNDLDTSLESLQIGAPRKSQPLLNARNAFLGNNRGPSLPSTSRSSITQSSWVAGGYWGSPTKSRAGRSPVQREREEAFPSSRSSSQSSGFVSHGSVNTNQESINRPLPQPILDFDRASINSDAGFVWNYETCSQFSQNELRSRAPFSDAQSVLSASSPSHAGSPDHLRLVQADQHEQLVRTLSRLSQHDLSNDLGKRSTQTSGRSPWIAFVLGMSVMANGFLALILFKSEVLVQLLT